MTTRKIVAVFDSQNEVNEARDQLLDLGLGADRISIADQSSSQHTLHTEGAHGSFWAHVKEMFMPHGDRHTLEESMRRGGYVLVATVDDERADEAIARLEAAGAVDLDEREGHWRAAAADSGAAVDAGAIDTGAVDTGDERRGQWRGATAAVDESERQPRAGEVGDAIPVVEERLRVGKREVNRGSVRVRSYIVEEPVHEEVRLREERVRIDRQPVDAPLSSAGAGEGEDPLRERTIEMTETAEEAVVGKEARVTEKVVVSKTAGERVEQIDDTVRHTEVEVQDNRDREGGASVQRSEPRGAASRDPRPIEPRR